MPFLVDRIAEDRAAADAVWLLAATLPAIGARDAEQDPGVMFAGVDIGWDEPNRFLRVEHVEIAEFLSRFDPRRAHHDAAAKERIIDEHRRTAGGECSICVATIDDRPVALVYPCPTLMCLTWSYAEHPDFDEVWDRIFDTGWP